MVKTELGLLFVMAILNTVHWLISIYSEDDSNSKNWWFRIFTSVFVVSGGFAGLSVFAFPK